ncbi:MAG TPA: hypothetical protein VLQ76_06225, partial [Bacteroidales bacterium]|nr:hypothetical protein [Bacteroidales bacterium]
MKRTLFILAVLFCTSSPFLLSQSFFTSEDHMINGYAKKTSGLDFEYHSCIPGLRESILIRATNGKDFMEWETDPVPGTINEKYATFVWIAALGSSPGTAGMDLTANDIIKVSFNTDARSQWDIEGEQG